MHMGGPPVPQLLPTDRTILEKGRMDHRPFGVTPAGEKIRDVSGVIVRANVEHLEDLVSRQHGTTAGHEAVEALCRQLNERMLDRAYHVSPPFLRNVWNSYSYEFVCFLGELCTRLSGDPTFQHGVGNEKFISPMMQTLARPFPVPQIYRMFPHFGEKFAKGSLRFDVQEVTPCSAVLRMQLTDRVARQFGPYRTACAKLICDSAKAALAAVPEKVHGLGVATIGDRTCMATGEEACEWEFHWTPRKSASAIWPAAALAVGVAAAASLRVGHQDPSWTGAIMAGLSAGMMVWLARAVWAQRRQLATRDRLIQEQLQSVDARHEELREAYLAQEQTVVDLRRRVAQATALHQAGLVFGSTLDRDRLLDAVLQRITGDLHYDRAMVQLFDPTRGVAYGTRLRGVPEDVAADAATLEMPVTDPESVEGTVLLKGQPLLIGDLEPIRDRLHPINQALILRTQVKSVISVPLKVQDRILGALTVNRIQEHTLTQDDLAFMTTLGNQVAIALDNAAAYRQIEELNLGLEARIQERTADLEKANARLRDLDNLKSAFVSVVSHELRTPMTSIKGYVDNLLEGLGGILTEKQTHSLTRVRHNTERLTRMINDLLDLSRIEARKVEMRWESLAVSELVQEVVESLQRAAGERGITLTACTPAPGATRGDRDKLHQVMTNLIQNAITFTPTGGAVQVDCRHGEVGWLYVSVADTGCGIPSDELERVFDAFYRASSAPANVRGAGLGLAITKHLVELHGGDLLVSSQLGRGSTFTVALPVDTTRL